MFYTYDQKNLEGCVILPPVIFSSSLAVRSARAQGEGATVNIFCLAQALVIVLSCLWTVVMRLYRITWGRFTVTGELGSPRSPHMKRLLAFVESFFFFSKITFHPWSVLKRAQWFCRTYLLVFGKWQCSCPLVYCDGSNRSIFIFLLKYVWVISF